MLDDETREDQDRQSTREARRRLIVHSARGDDEQQRSKCRGCDRRDVLG